VSLEGTIMPREDVHEAKPESLSIQHKTHTITLQSDKVAKGGWRPKGWIRTSTEDFARGLPVRDDSIPPSRREK
jgi:hypothetical protein